MLNPRRFFKSRKRSALPFLIAIPGHDRRIVRQGSGVSFFPIVVDTIVCESEVRNDPA